MKKGYIYILLTTFLFSSMEIALKLVSGQFNAIQITFLRFLIGSLVLLPLALRGLRIRKIRLRLNDLGFFALTGFICVVVSMIFYQTAILYSKASVVAVLFSCNPVFVVVFAFFILHEKIYKHTIISLAVSIAGILVIMNPGRMQGGTVGIVLTIIAAVTFALYGVVGRKRSHYYGGFGLTCFSFLFGSLELLLLIFASRAGAVSSFLTNAGLGTFANVPIFQGITASNLPHLIYISIGVTGFGYTFYFLAMEATSATTASMVFFIKPVLAPILALLILNEPITLNMAIGILLIISGSMISFAANIKMNKSKLSNEQSNS